MEEPAEDQGLGLPENQHILLDPDGREGNVLLVNGETGRTAQLQRGVPQRLRIVNTSNARFMRASISGHTLYTSGGWVFHCHILEHSARGMISFFQTQNPPASD